MRIIVDEVEMFEFLSAVVLELLLCDMEKLRDLI